MDIIIDDLPINTKLNLIIRLSNKLTDEEINKLKIYIAAGLPAPDGSLAYGAEMLKEINEFLSELFTQYCNKEMQK